MSAHVCGPGEVCGPGYEGRRHMRSPWNWNGEADGCWWELESFPGAVMFRIADADEKPALVWSVELPRAAGGDALDGIPDDEARAVIVACVAGFRAWLRALGPDVLARLPLAAAVRVQQLQAEARDG